MAETKKPKMVAFKKRGSGIAVMYSDKTPDNTSIEVWQGLSFRFGIERTRRKRRILREGDGQFQVKVRDNATGQLLYEEELTV